MATMINSSSVIRLFENNLFDYDEDRNLMIYRECEPNIEFSVPWLTNDVSKTYDLAKVRAIMGEMMKNVAHTLAVKAKLDDKEFMANLSKDMTDFGMQYVTDTDEFAYEENGKYLFVFDLEYLVSLLVINKNETVTSILTAMRDDARGKQNGKEEKDRV